VTTASAAITPVAVGGWIRRFAQAIGEHRQELVELDSAIGDGDHGTNMDRGMRKAVEKLDALESPDIPTILKTVGMALISNVGGAAGPLYGTFFLRMATGCAGRETLGLAEWTAAFEAAVDGVRERGKAQPGDKTMIDALVPALEELRSAAAASATLGDALARSADAAERGMRATTPLEARKGRASYLGPRSVGHQDPGASSTHLLVRSAAETLGGGPA
jgi:dihydroxyacetone kinase-like protein